MQLTKEAVAKRIDHSIVEQDATEAGIRIGCAEAREYGFGAFYVNPCYLKLAKDLLQDSGIPVGTTVSFPHGATITEVKLHETAQVLHMGADIIDVVMNVGMFKSGKVEYVRRELEQVIEKARSIRQDVIIKVIIETCNLSREEIVSAATMVKEVGADYVKTSSGCQARGATVDEIRLIKGTVGDAIKVKAAAGINTAQKALAMIEAGADCIGEIAGIAIVEGLDIALAARQER